MFPRRLQRDAALALSFHVVLAIGSINSLMAMGDEELGNGPANPANYVSHPGVIFVINDTHRVYRWWVNGNEQFFFEGDSVGLNAALEDFARIESEPLEVVLRPGPGTTKTFHQDKTIHFNWRLQLIGGIAAQMGKKDRGSNLWPSHPILHVYVGGPIQLSELVIPNNVSVISLATLKARYAMGLKSSDQDVRGWTCGQLAELDPYDVTVMKAIETMLADDSSWVRANAAGALSRYAGKGIAVKPSLQAASADADDSLKKQIAETLSVIERARDDPAAERLHQQTLAAIEEFCGARATKE